MVARSSSLYNIEIQPLEIPGDTYGAAASAMCLQEAGCHLYWEFDGLVYSALKTDEDPYPLAGFSQLELDPRERDLHISRMAIPQQYRRQRIGSLLVAHAINTANRGGCITISATPTSPASLRFFEAHRFERDPSRSTEGRLFRKLAQLA